jgi:hypothetical protein
MLCAPHTKFLTLSPKLSNDPAVWQSERQLDRQVRNLRRQPIERAFSHALRAA